MQRNTSMLPEGHYATSAFKNHQSASRYCNNSLSTWLGNSGQLKMEQTYQHYCYQNF